MFRHKHGSWSFLRSSPRGQGHVCHSEACGENSTDDGGAILVADGVPLGLRQSVLNRTRLGLASERRHRVHSASCVAPMVLISVSWR
jgi:hypothetical protein